MALNPTNCASAISASYNTYTATGTPSGNYQQDFAAAYKAYSQAGTLSAGGGVAGSESESIISSFLLGLTQGTTPEDFGAMMASYWGTCMLIPSGGAIGVVNNAASKAGAFTAAVQASYTTSESIPHFKTFIQNLETVAKTIQWTVTLPAPPYVRVETIS
jgi:hypothetical protein